MNQEVKSLWTWERLCVALDLPTKPGPTITGIHFDSRLIRSGDLFIPLSSAVEDTGKTSSSAGRDGHNFIAHAIANGAVSTFTDRKIEASIPQLFVPNTFEALWKIAKFRRRQIRSPVVAVTGSSGKTTFQCFLTSILKVPPLEGSFNNHIGVPLSMARTQIDSEYAVYEIGTNHPGEIEPLANLVNPDIAVLLNITEAHIGNFESLGALVEEKFSICSGLKEEGVLVLPHSLLSNDHNVSGRNCVTFGFDENADITIKHGVDNCYTFSNMSESIDVEIPGGGHHRAQTLAACAAVLQALGIRLSQLDKVTSNLPKGRGNEHCVDGITIIDDSYNANPASMKEALVNLQNRPTLGKRIAILGQMNELGEKSSIYHAHLGKYIKNIDVVYCVGRYSLPLFEQIRFKKSYFFDSVNEYLLKKIVKGLESDDVVLVKGSNSVFWKHQFVDRLVQQLQSNNIS